MIRKLRPAFAFVVFVIALLTCYWIMWLLVTPKGWWFFVAGPPVPPYATHVDVFYPSNDVERGLSFETEQSFTTIQQFYREELPKHGWVFRCTVVPPPAGAQVAGTDNAEMGSVQPTPTSTPAPSEVVPPSDVGTGVTDVYERRGVRWIGREQTLQVVISEHESSEGTGLTTRAGLSEYKYRFVEQMDRCPAQ